MNPREIAKPPANASRPILIPCDSVAVVDKAPANASELHTRFLIPCDGVALLNEPP